MKAYLATTGGLFALLGGAHVWVSIAHWRRLGEDPWFILEGPGIGLIAVALAFWAWRLTRSLRWPTG